MEEVLSSTASRIPELVVFVVLFGMIMGVLVKVLFKISSACHDCQRESTEAVVGLTAAVAEQKESNVAVREVMAEVRTLLVRLNGG
jgi:hypothetical protein